VIQFAINALDIVTNKVRNIRYARKTENEKRTRGIFTHADLGLKARMVDVLYCNISASRFLTLLSSNGQARLRMSLALLRPLLRQLAVAQTSA